VDVTILETIHHHDRIMSTILIFIYNCVFIFIIYFKSLNNKLKMVSSIVEFHVLVNQQTDALKAIYF
jgi:hypothetical protein